MNFAWIVVDWSAVSSLCTVIALTYSLPALLVGLVMLLRLRPERDKAQQTGDVIK
jgi:hypothetical protein